LGKTTKASSKITIKLKAAKPVTIRLVRLPDGASLQMLRNKVWKTLSLASKLVL